MKIFRSILYFIIGLLLSAYAEFSYAANPSPTVTYSFVGGGCPLKSYSSSTMADLANQLNSAMSVTMTYSVYPTCVAVNDTLSFSVVSFTISGLDITQVYQTYFNSALQSGTLNIVRTAIKNSTCPNPYIYNSVTNTCDTATTPNSCNLAAGTVISSGYYDLGTTQTPVQTPPISLCAQNCFVTFSGDSPYGNLVNGVEHIYAKGNYSVSATGAAGYCSTNSPISSTSSVGSTLPFPSCGTGKSVAYVNGKAICYANSTSTTTPPPVTSSSSVTNGTNTQGQPTTTTTTTNADGSTTTSVTTTTPTGTTTSTTTTQPAATDKATFCSANPTDPSCATRDPCLDNPNRIGCMDAGSSQLEEPAQVIKNLNFSPISIPQDATCPAPQHITVFSRQMTIPFDPLCSYANGIRPVLLAFAYLWASYIILGAMKDG